MVSSEESTASQPTPRLEVLHSVYRRLLERPVLHPQHLLATRHVVVHPVLRLRWLVRRVASRDLARERCVRRVD